MAQITIFSKKRTTDEGRTFYTYTGRIKRKDGTEQTVEIKFRESCGKPDGAKCPMNIIVNKDNCSMSQRQITIEKTGEVKTVYKMWVSDWSEGDPYVDHSMDDYDL